MLILRYIYSFICLSISCKQSIILSIFLLKYHVIEKSFSSLWIVSWFYLFFSSLAAHSGLLSSPAHSAMSVGYDIVSLTSVSFDCAMSRWLSRCQHIHLKFIVMNEYYEQVREELESRSCKIRTGYAVQSVVSTDGGKVAFGYIISGHRFIFADKIEWAILPWIWMNLLLYMLSYDDQKRKSNRPFSFMLEQAIWPNKAILDPLISWVWLYLFD